MVRVLVVEDEELLAAAVADGLIAEGFDVDVSHDGPDGLWRAREGSYDAIVLDVLLPGMHGYKVCRTLRDEGVWTPDPDPHRQGRRVRRGRGPRHRRRRLPVEAVLVRRATRPVAGPDPPRRSPAADGALRRHARARPRRAPLPAQGDRRPPHRPRVRAARVPRAQGRQRRVEDGDPRPRVGHGLRRRPERGRGVRRATCARRSTPRSGSSRSRPCAARATSSSRIEWPDV